MQEFKTLNERDKTDVLNSMIEGEQYQLKDNRDEKTYYVSKLADGNVWMTQNLDHDIVTTTDFYTPANTDIPSNWTASTATYPTGTTTWDSSTSGITFQSYDPGDLYWSGIPGDSTQVSSGDAHYHSGNYYSWTAAVAIDDGSYTVGADVNQSICPAGWMLPKGANNSTNSGSFQFLLAQYGWDSNTSKLGNDKQPWESPFYFSLTGRWTGRGTPAQFGNYGTFWASESGAAKTGRDLNVAYDGTLENSINTIVSGRSVRCMAR